ncbi:MAG TPA: transglycosylase domain-containing protein [Bacteroidales bacterium]
MAGKNFFSNYLVRFWIFIISLMMLGALFFAGVAWGWFGKMPTFEELENPDSYLASEVISSDDVVLGTYFIENRSNVSYRDISPDMINALLAIEDIRFEEHSGIDEKALLRVFVGVATGSNKGGGSTITQQLAKNLFPRGELNKLQLVIRKFQEWVTAVKLERYYSKEEIVAMYLNTVFFGHNSYGIKSAAATYFDKTPDSLNIQESALMAGVVNAPSRYSPFSRPQAATERRNLVLSQMLKYNFISQSEFDSVIQLPLGVSKYGAGDHNSGTATYFREYLRNEMKKWCANHFKADGTPYDLYRDGLKIYTTIDSRMQRYAEEAVTEHLAKDLQPSFFKHWKGRPFAPFSFEDGNPEAEVNALMLQAAKRSERYRLAKKSGMRQDSIMMLFEKPTEMVLFSWDGPIDTIMTPYDSILYYKYFLQAGLMSMESSTGYVKAYVGGIDQRFFQYDHVTQGKRQVGSTFKPFLYALAMQEGEYSPCYKIPNIQYSVELDDGTYWAPKNSSDERIGEEVTLKWALANSNNWISAYLIGRFSPESVIKMARSMGITSDMPAVPAIALGTPDISLYEMVGAMNTFADKGVYVKPIFITKIEDKNGNVLERFVAEKTEAIDEITAYKMIELMKGVVQTGTGIRLRYKYKFDNPIAGKTGTTQNQSDGWFMGITPDLTTGVWVGAEDRSVHFRSITLGQGANMALPIWALYMRKVYNDPNLKISQGDFSKPLKSLPFLFDCESSENEYNQQVLKDEDEF